MKKILSIINMALFILCIILITGCEDDAILKPQNESECTGSYCNLSLPYHIKSYKSINPSIF